MEPKVLSEFCDSQYWDSFFKARGGRPFEWYGDWSLISKLVTEQCGLGAGSEQQKILIPGCGNSTLSADMYDAGFTNIVNIDFSRTVIKEMLKLHVRSRPRMRWLVMDMTKMELADDSFDVVVDKGGLDALLGEPEDDRSSGLSFLCEINRILRTGGRFSCITLAQKHVIELLLCTFRTGWLLSVHGLQLSAVNSPSSLQPFLVIAKHEGGENLQEVLFDLDLNWQGASNEFQMQGVVQAVDKENILRREGLADSGNSKYLEGNPQNIYDKLHPGRRLTTKLVSEDSRLPFTAVILDAKDKIDFEYSCAVFLVLKGTAHQWLYSTAEGQWEIVENVKAGRLILVSLDPNLHADDITKVKEDLSPLVKPFVPLESRESGTVPFVIHGDGVESRNILAEVESPITGPIVVEDVRLTDKKPKAGPTGAKFGHFRRLMFRRNPNLIQSEALLVRRREGVTGGKHGTGKRKKKPAQEAVSTTKPDVSAELKVDHSYLVSPYHGGMIAAFVLIARNLEQWLASKREIRLMLVGLGAGSLPMFVHDHLPIDNIQVVELDPVVGDVAKLHFGFVEDNRMRLQIGDGLVAVHSIASQASKNLQQALKDDSDHQIEVEEAMLPLRKLQVEDRDKKADSGLHVLIIDADSTDLGSGMSCPPVEFLEDSFLIGARSALVDGGMLITNVVSRATTHQVQALAQLKKFFEEIYYIEVSEDVNRVLIALPKSRNSGKSPDIMKDLSVLETILKKFAPWGNGPNLREILKDLRRLK